MNTPSQSLALTPPDPSFESSPRSAMSSCALSLTVTDMHCAACAAFIEDALRKRDGVVRAYVHFATQRARIVVDSELTSRADVIAAIRALGYGTEAESPADQQALTRRARRRHLWLFGLATLCAMQLMMLTVPRYLAGAELERDLATLLDWSALALVLPVLLVACQPFYEGGLRELRIRRPGMDSAVVLGVLTAFAGSCWHLSQQSGSLYFDSIAMFVALLLAVRWFEWEQRERNQSQIAAALAQRDEARTRRVTSRDGIEAFEDVAVSALRVGDHVSVRTGEAIPADGRLLSAFAECDESMLTGESAAVQRRTGEQLFGGAVNRGPTIELQVSATVEDSSERRLLSLADFTCKPATLRISERVARWFMPLLLLAAGLSFAVLLPQGVELAVERAIAVLIISCPCALALAAPAAYARAFAVLLSAGVVVRRDGALERLAVADSFVLDKTGTLTEPAIESLCIRRKDVGEAWCYSTIAALEQTANHPLANLFRPEATGDAVPPVEAAHWVAGEGVEGSIAGIRYRFGRPDFAAGVQAGGGAAGSQPGSTALWLCDSDGLICEIVIGETLKGGAHRLIAKLKQQGTVELCSGDVEAKVARVAAQLNVNSYRAAMTPPDKARRIAELQQTGRTVVMIGDGVNDSVGFAGADVAIATGGATDIARASADFVCAGRELEPVLACVLQAASTLRVVKSNFAWAIGYNLVAIPCALLGWVNPLVAGVGMAASSAIVMLNILRIRTPETTA